MRRKKKKLYTYNDVTELILQNGTNNQRAEKKIIWNNHQINQIPLMSALLIYLKCESQKQILKEEKKKFKLTAYKIIMQERNKTPKTVRKKNI